MPTTKTASLGKGDIAELGEWAARIVADANGWAERAEVSCGQVAELTKHLDAIASKASHVTHMADALGEQA